MELFAKRKKGLAALMDDYRNQLIALSSDYPEAKEANIVSKEAGEIAGFEVLQVLNEPTAAALTYDFRTEETEKVLVYDLGGGTFDVSIVEITGDVTEVLASHGNNRLGGDDFDLRLQRYLADRFRQTHNTALPEDAVTEARLLRAAEQAKMALSEHAFTTVREPFLVSQGKTALHLEIEIARKTFEDLIEPMIEETLQAIDRALSDANLKPDDLNRVILVGGSTRIPLVQNLVANHLGQAPIDGIQPDLCVALGAAIQAGVLSGESVEAILVDVIPHSLGIAVAMDTQMGTIPGLFSTIIPRNSVIPVSRSQVYSTMVDNQEVVQVEVYQGENAIARENVPLGEFRVENLPHRPAGDIQLEVHFDFDHNGILTVTATEKGEGQQTTLVVNDTETTRLSSHELTQARSNIESLFEMDALMAAADDVELTPSELLDEAYSVLETLESDKAEVLSDVVKQVEAAIAAQDEVQTAQLLDTLTLLLDEVA
jgi:molecular chaperone DnaK